MILVTGGSGFLGQYVVQELKRKDCDVYAPHHTSYDLTDPGAVRKLMRNNDPEVVIHLAAVVGGIGANRESPAKFFYDNAVMGIHLMHEARRWGVVKFVQVGTVCSYPKNAKVPFSEDAIWNGYPEETNAPYGLAKKMLLVMAQAYRSQYKFNAIYLIPTNLYGPGDNFDLDSGHVIPAIIRKCIEAKAKGENEVVLWGDGSPTREFLYVEDAARAIVLATERYDKGAPVNIGSKREISIARLALMIQEIVGYKGQIVWDKTKPNGQPRRKLDISRAEREFGFRATTSLEDGLEKTIKWYQGRLYNGRASSGT